MERVGDIEYYDDNSVESHRVMTDLSHEVFHDFKNILAIISGLAQISMIKTQSEEVREYLNRINNATFEFRDVLNRYYSVINLCSNTSMVQEPFYISDIMKEVLDVISFKFLGLSSTKSNVSLDVNISSNERVLCDGYGLHQSLLNLVMNALDAMEDDSQAILRVNIYNDENNRNVIIEITDTGIGISEENMKRIFNDQFTTKKNGTGLGLRIAKNAIESIGGSLYISSKLNIGTKVTVILPIFFNIDNLS